MPAAAELYGPVAYDTLRWSLLAGGGLLGVALYFGLVLWLTRTRRTRDLGLTVQDETARRRALNRLDQVAADATARRSTAREAHRQVSETVRGFVAAATGVPALTMTLADLERKGPERLASVVALLYVSEFGPDDRQAALDLDAALAAARDLVTSWE